MKAIATYRLSPTNYRGSRIKATDDHGNSITRSVPDELGASEVHAWIAKELARKMNWRGQWVGGHLGRGMVWVNQNWVHPENYEAFDV